MEERIVNLPLSGDVLMTVVRTDEYPSYMNTLETTVRKHEQFMGVPYPNKHAFLVVADIGGGGYASGVNAERIAIDIGYAEVGDVAVRGVIGHEVGHSYWGGTHPWMTEGGAVFLQRMGDGLDMSEFNFRIREGTCPASEGHGGAQFYNLSELENEESLRDTHCYYNMGSGIFYNLYDVLGEDIFHRGFQTLHQNINAEKWQGRQPHYFPGILRDGEWYEGVRYEACSRLKIGESLCHMKAAFVAGQEPDIAAKADSILKLWFTARPDTADS